MLDGVYVRSAELLEENSTASKALYTHLKQILPCIAFYEALLKKTGSKEEALKLYDEWAFDDLKKIAVMLRKFMGMGLYKKAPAIFDKMIDKAFGSSADELLPCPLESIAYTVNCSASRGMAFSKIS